MLSYLISYLVQELCLFFRPLVLHHFFCFVWNLVPPSSWPYRIKHILVIIYAHLSIFWHPPSVQSEASTSPCRPRFAVLDISGELEASAGRYRTYLQVLWLFPGSLATLLDFLCAGIVWGIDLKVTRSRRRTWMELITLKVWSWYLNWFRRSGAISAFLPYFQDNHP